MEDASSNVSGMHADLDQAGRACDKRQHVLSTESSKTKQNMSNQQEISLNDNNSTNLPKTLVYMPSVTNSSHSQLLPGITERPYVQDSVLPRTPTREEQHDHLRPIASIRDTLTCSPDTTTITAQSQGKATEQTDGSNGFPIDMPLPHDNAMQHMYGAQPGGSTSSFFSQIPSISSFAAGHFQQPNIGTPTLVQHTPGQPFVTIEPSEANVVQPKSKGRVRRPPVRKRYPDFIVNELEKFFIQDNYPTREQYTDIANVMHLDISRVKVWFQNRRSRERRQAKREQEPGKKRGATPLARDVALPDAKRVKVELPGTVLGTTSSLMPSISKSGTAQQIPRSFESGSGGNHQGCMATNVGPNSTKPSAINTQLQGVDSNMLRPPMGSAVGPTPVPSVHYSGLAGNVLPPFCPPGINPSYGQRPVRQIGPSSTSALSSARDPNQTTFPNAAGSQGSNVSKPDIDHKSSNPYAPMFMRNFTPGVDLRANLSQMRFPYQTLPQIEPPQWHRMRLVSPEELGFQNIFSTLSSARPYLLPYINDPLLQTYATNTRPSGTADDKESATSANTAGVVVGEESIAVSDSRSSTPNTATPMNTTGSEEKSFQNSTDHCNIFAKFNQACLSRAPVLPPAPSFINNPFSFPWMPRGISGYQPRHQTPVQNKLPFGSSSQGQTNPCVSRSSPSPDYISNSNTFQKAGLNNELGSVIQQLMLKHQQPPKPVFECREQQCDSRYGKVTDKNNNVGDKGIALVNDETYGASQQQVNYASMLDGTKLPQYPPKARSCPPYMYGPGFMLHDQQPGQPWLSFMRPDSALPTESAFQDSGYTSILSGSQSCPPLFNIQGLPVSTGINMATGHPPQNQAHAFTSGQMPSSHIQSFSSYTSAGLASQTTLTTSYATPAHNTVKSSYPNKYPYYSSQQFNSITTSIATATEAPCSNAKPTSYTPYTVSWKPQCSRTETPSIPQQDTSILLDDHTASETEEAEEEEEEEDDEGTESYGIEEITPAASPARPMGHFTSDGEAMQAAWMPSSASGVAFTSLGIDTKSNTASIATADLSQMFQLHYISSRISPILPPVSERTVGSVQDSALSPIPDGNSGENPGPLLTSTPERKGSLQPSKHEYAPSGHASTSNTGGSHIIRNLMATGELDKESLNPCSNENTFSNAYAQFIQKSIQQSDWNWASYCNAIQSTAQGEYPNTEVLTSQAKTQSDVPMQVLWGNEYQQADNLTSGKTTETEIQLTSQDWPQSEVTYQPCLTEPTTAIDNNVPPISDAYFTINKVSYEDAAKANNTDPPPYCEAVATVGKGEGCTDRTGQTSHFSAPSDDSTCLTIDEDVTIEECMEEEEEEENEGES